MSDRTDGWSRPRDIPLLVSIPAGGHVARHAEPVTGGVPLPRGLARDGDRWQLLTEDGRPLPLQTTATDRWPDGSVRWLLVDSQVSAPADAVRLALTLRLQSTDSDVRGSCRVHERDSEVLVEAGAYAFRLRTDSPGVVSSVTSPAGSIYDGAAAELRIIGGGGERWRVRWDRTVVECSGSMRVATVTEGSATSPSGDSLALFLRLDFFTGHSVVRARLTVRNPRRAEHPGGIWELGDAGSVQLKEVSVVLPVSAEPEQRLWLSPEPGQLLSGVRRVSLYQESSGGEHWSSPNHRDRHGIVPLRFRGYEREVDGAVVRGMRATPTLLVKGGASAIGVAVPGFWQNFPRALEATPSTLRVSVFPPEAPALHELQGGEQKTHEWFVSFAADTITDPALEWCRSRAVLHAMPQWYVQSGAIANLVAAHDEDSSYRALVDAALVGGDTFVAKRETADEYGWRHFGDIYGDHEAVFNKAGVALMSHYNNQYDPVAGFFWQFIRTADTRWWQQCVDLAAHVIDIDLYHTDEDKAAYNQGLFWHTYHYIDAGTATHRSYPRGTVGGGPSSEHNYPTGLMYVYFATGDEAARDAAIGLARFVVHIDDGSRTVFRYLAGGCTGIASASRTPDYHGPGRGSGNSLNALLDGHRLTGERHFLDKAEQLIRRCTHPREEIARLNLLDPENRWFYTMFLQALGKYLQWKVELDELDAMYAYGRDVLVHFARWMAEHERPYLDRPDLLEYPTETWPAQDIRKSEVFDYAARHAPDADRARFAERAEFFYRYSIDTLSGLPTRTLARPVVLLLVHGLLRAHVRTHGITPAPAPRGEWAAGWPTPEIFVPQKARAKRRLKQIAAAGVVGLLGAAAAAGVALLR